MREVRVRGEDAVEAMIETLESLEETPGVDIVVFARSGGSVEDLLPFSGEKLVRAIAKAKKPVVSAIGREGDNPILDLVADPWASTPTDAAKHIVPDVVEEPATIAEAAHRGRSAVQTDLDRAQSELDSTRARPTLAFPETIVGMHEEDLLSFTRQMRTRIDRAIVDTTDELTAAVANLQILSPRATLDRGCSILFSKRSVVSSAAVTHKGQEAEAILARGRLVLAVVAIAEQDGAVAEKGLAVSQDDLTAAAP